MTSEKFYAIWEIDADGDKAFISDYHDKVVTYRDIEDVEACVAALRMEYPTCIYKYKIYECTPIKESK